MLRLSASDRLSVPSLLRINCVSIRWSKVCVRYWNNHGLAAKS